MKHQKINRNPYMQEWFCVKCGRTSSRTSEEDARAELEMHDCARSRFSLSSWCAFSKLDISTPSVF
jgi:hypothetical protein